MSTTERWNLVHAPHGIASLRHTHWLDSEPQSYDGAPGRWWAADGLVHGIDVPGIDAHGADGSRVGSVRLEPFVHVAVGDLRLRAFAREGSLALRVYDPQNPARLALQSIESFDRDAGWALPGHFTAAAVGEERLVRSVDGHESTHAAVGTVAVTVSGQEYHLVVSGDEGGLSAVIADETAADGAYRFRFLPIAEPDADGAVTVDFNDAYLPPCAFSDEYVCPLPPPANRIAAPVTAGERRAIRE